MRYQPYLKATILSNGLWVRFLLPKAGRIGADLAGPADGAAGDCCDFHTHNAAERSARGVFQDARARLGLEGDLRSRLAGARVVRP